MKVPLKNETPQESSPNSICIYIYIYIYICVCVCVCVCVFLSALDNRFICRKLDLLLKNAETYLMYNFLDKLRLKNVIFSI